jgi:hypothetical protein
MRRWLLTLPLLIVVGCQQSPPNVVTANSELVPISPYTVELRDHQASEPALLWNGVVGVRVGRFGSVESGSQTAFRADAYGGPEEKLAPLPNPLDVRLELNKRSAKEDVSEYVESLDFRTGILTTSWRTGDVAVKVRTELPPGSDMIGQTWEVFPIKEAYIKFTMSPTLDKPIVEGYAGGHFGTVDKTSVWDGKADEGQLVTFKRKARVGNKAEIRAPASTLTADIEIDGPVDDQQAIRSFIYYLKNATPSAGNLGPFGLSNSQYNGHVFWDADIWVAPALWLLQPEAAKAIANYRLSHAGGYRRNYLEWIKTRPTGSGRLGSAPDKGGLKVAWESSTSGLETVPGPSKFQDHITGSVVWSLERAAAFGLADARKVSSFGLAAREFYAQRVSGADLKGTMSPDEHHIGDNDLYTNILAERVLNRYGDGGLPYALRRPKDSKGLLSYDGDKLRGYKQAAGVLAIYPLQDSEAEAQANSMLERMELAVSKNGPAMTDSVHALILARQGEANRAYETWRSSWKDFTNNPLLLFSEKRHKPLTYFVTGAGGCLQTVLYGFVGLRIDDKKPANAKWTLALQNGFWLSANPNLPKAWKSVRLRKISILGKRFDLTATNEGVTVD